MRGCDAPVTEHGWFVGGHHEACLVRRFKVNAITIEVRRGEQTNVPD